MNRGSIATLVICSVATALIAFALTVITRTGMAGGYAFIFLGLLAQSLFLLWPDVRRRLRKRRTTTVR